MTSQPAPDGQRPRYQLSAEAAEWITGQFGADDPSTPAPHEVSGLITAAIGDQIIAGGPDGADLAANCIAGSDGEPDGWKIMIGPRHLDFWVTSGMKRTTNGDGIEVPRTYLEFLAQAVDVANGLLTAWEDATSPGSGPPGSWAADWNSAEDAAAYDSAAATGPCICEGREGHTNPRCPWYEGEGT